MPRVLLIGWDGAGWNQVQRLVDSGAMPHMARMIENGVMSKAAALPPLCSPLLWTTVSTGQFADRHGVLDTAEPDIRTAGIRPVTRSSLRSPQVWDLLAREGLRCQSVGWPVTHPAAGPAVCVSNGFAAGLPGSVYPATSENTLSELRFGPQEWTGDELQAFVPGWQQVDQDKDRRLARLALILAEAVSVHAAATTLMQTNPSDFTAVWFGAVARAIEAFPADTDAVYKDVVSGVYRFLDIQLGRLLELAGPDATVMLVSDRAAAEAKSINAAGAGPQGIFCAKRPGIAPDELTFGVGLLDVAPTVLALFGYARTSEMPGQQVFEVCAELPSKPLRAYEMPVHAPGDASSAADDLAALHGMGYKDAVGNRKLPESEAARKRRDVNLGWVLLSQDRVAEVVPLLERMVEEDPARADIRLYLAHAYFLNGRIPECRTICDALASEFPGSPLAPYVRAHLAIVAGRLAEARQHLEAGREFHGMLAGLDAAIGETYLKLRQPEEAAEAFRWAIHADLGMAAAHEGLARALLAAGHHPQAAEAAMDAIRIRYDFPSAHVTLGHALNALGREDAARQALAIAERLRRGRAAA